MPNSQLKAIARNPWWVMAREAVGAAKQRARLLGRYPAVAFERGVQVKGPLKHLVLGEGCVIQQGCVLHLGGAAWCDAQGSLEIGARAVLSPHTVLYAAGPFGIQIGDDFDCGPGVGVYACRTDYTRGPGQHVFGRVTIGSRVTIFAGAVISPGVTLGDDCAIAAGAVITRDVPAGMLAGGVPGRVIRRTR